MSDNATKKEFDITVGDDGKVRVTCSEGIAFVDALGNRSEREDGILGWSYRIGAWVEQAELSNTILFVDTRRQRADDLLDWARLPPWEVIKDFVRMVREQNGIVVETLDRVERLRIERDRAIHAYDQAVAFKAAPKKLKIDYDQTSPRCALCHGHLGTKYVAGTLMVEGQTPVVGSFCAACMQGVEFGNVVGPTVACAATAVHLGTCRECHP